MAHIRWRTRQKKWYVYFYSEKKKVAKPLPSTVPRREQLTRSEYKNAQMIAAQIEHEQHQITHSELDLETAAAYWLDDCRIGLSQATWDSYKSRILQLLNFLEPDKEKRLPISSITPHDLRRWRTERLNSVSGNTVRNDLKAVQAFFTWCVRQGHLTKSPADSVIIPKREYKEARIATTDEVKRMFALLESEPHDPAFRALAYMGALCGMRRGEILSIRWQDINFAERFFRVFISKSSRPRNIPMPEEILQLFMDIGQDGEAVFPEVYRKGKQRRSPDVARRFNAWLKANGFGFTHKALRHWCNDELRKMGMESVARRHIIGHNSEAVNAIYCHPKAEEARPYLEQLSGHLSDLRLIESPDPDSGRN